jgi:hypothetical protein
LLTANKMRFVANGGGPVRSSMSDTACNYGCCRTSRVLELVRSNEARFASTSHLPSVKTTTARPTLDGGKHETIA